MSAKLRAILKGHKGAVAKIYTKFELEQSHADEATNMVNILSTEESLKKKIEIISTLHERILDVIPEDRQEEIEFEVLEQEEYIFNLQTKLQTVRSYRVSHSNINNSHAARVSNDHTSFHRLPKLELPTFSGSVIEWQAYWDAYESAIHEHSSLSSVQKFNYLRSTLNGEALQTVSGFSLTNANYEKAVSLLHERFGQTDKIIQSYMMSLLEIPAPTYTFCSLREFYDSTEVYIRGLDSLGQTENSYGSLLVPVILQKLPQEVRRNITRAHGTSWTLFTLMKCLLNEVTILDAGSPLENSTKIGCSAFLYESAPASTLLTNTDNSCPHTGEEAFTRVTYKRKCAFCKGDHGSAECKKIRHYEQRIKMIKRNRMCFNCLGKHKIAECKSQLKCKFCTNRHHTSICKKESQETNEHNAKRSRHTQIHQKSERSTATGPVLLKTAVAEVQSTSSSSKANIVLDEGAQSTFITEALARKLQMVPTDTEVIHSSAFGDTVRHEQHVKSASISLHTENGPIPIKVLIVPDISAPIKARRSKVRELEYLKDLRLAHPVTEEEEFNIDFLIGADYYWSIVQDEIIRGKGPTAVKSKLGYLVSGPLPKENGEQSGNLTNMMTVFTTCSDAVSNDAVARQGSEQNSAIFTSSGSVEPFSQSPSSKRHHGLTRGIPQRQYYLDRRYVYNATDQCNICSR